jgi:adenosylcobyric acid synthase
MPRPDEPLPDLIILPGSKSTMADLVYLRSSALEDYIHSCHDSGIPIVGICGGYQMLGRQLLDPLGVESATASLEDLGLLEGTTTFEPRKTTVQVRAVSLDHEEEIVGYEIHMGRTECSTGFSRPLLRIIEQCGKPTDRLDGAVSIDGSVWGTYLHGAFDAPVFRRRILNGLRERRGWTPLPAGNGPQPEKVLDSLAALIREHLDLATLEQVVNRPV